MFLCMTSERWLKGEIISGVDGQRQVGQAVEPCRLQDSLSLNILLLAPFLPNTFALGGLLTLILTLMETLCKVLSQIPGLDE